MLLFGITAKIEHPLHKVEDYTIHFAIPDPCYCDTQKRDDLWGRPAVDAKMEQPRIFLDNN
jgi:hypothetical protein